jgi:hypothetical protein
MERFERRIGIRPLAQKSDPGDHVVVVDNLAVLAVIGPCKLSEPDLGTLGDDRYVANSERRALPRDEHGFFDIAYIPHEPHFPHVNLLKAGFDKASAGIGIIVRELLLDLSDAEPIRNEFVGIQTNLIFAGRSSKTRDVHDVRHRFQILFHHPILDGL